MKKRILALFLLFAGLFLSQARADILMLVHGYLSGAHSWDNSAIIPALERHGWRRAGVFAAGPHGVRLIPAAGVNAAHKIYSIDLPSEAPVTLQAFQLREALDSISRVHQDEAVYLVGHSAGGVVARAALVRGDNSNIKALITIASPHLGTWRAEQALDVTDIPFPFSLVTDFLGGETYHTAQRSRGLYVDLVRPRPGTLLFWLNQVPHPDIRYFSVIHSQVASGSDDYIVPAYSQDMNNIPVLRGKSARISLNAPHELSPLDGTVLVNLLAGIQ